MIAKAGEISRLPGHWLADQLKNEDGAAGYTGLGEEIWRQTDGKIDALVHTVSTAHSLHGMSRALKLEKHDLLVFAVEPDESAVLSGRPPGSHKIEGIGLGFLPPLWNRKRSTRSSLSQPMTQKRWHEGSQGKRRFSLVHLRAPILLQHSEWLSGLVQELPLQPSLWILVCVISARMFFVRYDRRILREAQMRFGISTAVAQLPRWTRSFPSHNASAAPQACPYAAQTDDCRHRGNRSNVLHLPRGNALRGPQGRVHAAVQGRQGNPLRKS